MRLLKQISLDGHTSLSLSSSLHSFRFHHDVSNNKLNINFGKNLTEILDRNVRLLTLTNDHSKSYLNTSDKSLLKALEELNSYIVSLIEMCRYSTTQSTNNIKDCSNIEKQKSKLRRHYSALVDSGHLFLGKRSHLSGPTEKEPTFPSNDLIHTESVIENSIHKLIESNILNLLVDSIPNIGFEEKKMARIIMTNSLTIDVKKNKIIVDYFCDPSNQILRSLVESYEHGRSDITLNCGSILRFASQFEPILIKLLQSSYFYKFFIYMKRSSSDYPFDVAMDVFYTFKTFMIKHKQVTTRILQTNSGHFFSSLINLLEHAEVTEDYVTKRQTLEMFTEIFSGDERSELREKFLIQNDFICSVIRYLYNRNLQIRLRCLSLLSQFFMNPSTEKNYIEQNMNDPSEKKNRALSPGSWQMDLLIKKIKITYIEYKNNDENINDENVDIQIKDNFIELKSECLRSNIKQFNQLVIFVDQLIRALIESNL